MSRQNTAAPSIRVSVIASPLFLLLVPALLSAFAWTVPGAGLQLRGFSTRTPLTVAGVLIVFTWYAACAVCLVVGRMGARVLHNHSTSSESIASVEPFKFSRFESYTLTILSLIGVSWSLWTAYKTGSLGVAFNQSLGNALTESLGGQAGLATLRYTTTIAAPFTVLQTLLTRRQAPIAVLNVVLLLVNVTFSSRLSLLLALVVGLVLTARYRPRARLSAGLLLPAGLIVFGLLTAFNYLRNSLYYLSLGVSNPVAMNFYQFAAYLGAPVQTALGMANESAYHDYQYRGSSYNSLLVLTPTFLKGDNPVYLNLTSRPTRYPDAIDLQGSLTTNSSFADTLAAYGYLGLFIALLVLVLVGYLVETWRTLDAPLVLASGVLSYGIAETWRIYLFDQGIIVYLVAILVLLALVRRLKPGGTSYEGGAFVHNARR